MAIILVFVHPERRPIILVLVLVFVTKIALQVDLPVNSRGTPLGASTNQSGLMHLTDLAADENSILNLDAPVDLDDATHLGEGQQGDPASQLTDKSSTPIASSVDQARPNRPTRANCKPTWMTDFVCIVRNKGHLPFDSQVERFFDAVNLCKAENKMESSRSSRQLYGAASNQTLGVKCPECGAEYTTVRGLKKHSVLKHGQ